MRKVIYGFSVFLFLFVLSTAFYCTYRVSQLQAEVRELREDDGGTVRVNTEPADGGYYLEAEDGYVQVYKGDRQTLYEPTGIALESLPDKLQEEIRRGKHLTSELELYGFLENYSS